MRSIPLEPIKSRYASLSAREQRLVQIAAVLIGLLLFFMLIFGPIQRLKSSGRAEFAAAAETRALVEQASRSGTRGPVSGEPLRAVLEQTSGQAGIVIARYDFEAGEDAVDLSVQDTGATSLLTWLTTLSEQHGVVVREGSIRATGDEGLVTARLTLERSS
ncbi:type II secretion system protein GspM [Parvularcula dongshanensis]|uniref:Type II secretory pathway component PulM n=1 Tax=Parvularcula dongshanensis TaxID=1173995 RepID=A0A840HXQ5_9PROT|nr:type II secretory pathway component PulM [Parvularcula dongshanensis]